MKNCIGCQACVDLCPQNAIHFTYDIWGEGSATIDVAKCVKCGLCDRICPAKVADRFPVQNHVYAAISKKHRTKGSSGGLFFELSQKFIEQGGIVYGAAFDKSLKLIHQSAKSLESLSPLCKSKYLHSDMLGVYKEIKSYLEHNENVMFVGTPCQVSAVKNAFLPKHRQNLILVDFLCHGTGTQKIFDLCIAEEEKKCKGKITEFSFRSRSKHAPHCFTYKYEKGNKQKTVSGYSCEFPYYSSFLKYTIFNDACYSCPYSTNARVGDITIGDFWGVDKYNKSINPQKGCSMLCINSQVGLDLFNCVKDSCSVFEFPLKNAAANNQSFYEPVSYPDKKTFFVQVLTNEGESALVKAMTSKNIKKEKLYARCPKKAIRVYNKLKSLIR